MAGVFDDVTAARSNVLERLSAGQPVDPAERERLDQISASQQGEFRKGLRRAAYNASATTDAFIGGMAEPFAPDFAARQFQKAENTLRTQPTNLRPQVESFRDVNDVGSAGAYAAGTLGEAATSIGGMVAAGLAARLGLGSALRLGATGKNIAQYGGSMAAMLPQEGGETALSLRNNPEAMANTTAGERAALTLGRGTINSALESVVPNLLLTNAIAGTARRIAPGVAPALSNIGRKAAAGVVGEGATEGAQELTGQFAENVAAPGTGYDTERVMEAAIRGAISGGVLGGAGGTIQAARSNIDAASEAAADKTNTAVNRAFEQVDKFIRDPEQAGVDMTNATMGAVAEAADRAREAGQQASDAAGPAAAKGMDAIAAIREKFDVAVAGQLTPENRQKYVDLTKNFRLLQPAEYEILRDALETGDSAQINNAVGSVSRLLADRVPRETLQGIKNFSNWAKRFGAGVTNAARERKASVLRYSPSEVTDFGGYLRDNHPELTNFFLHSQEPAARLQSVRALMAVRDGNVSPKQMDELQEIMQTAGISLTEVAKDIRSSAARTYVTRQQQPASTPLTPQEEREAWGGGSQIDAIAEKGRTFMTPAVQAQWEELGKSIGPGVTFAEDGTTYDANGNVMDPEDPTNTPFSSLELVQRIQSVDTLGGKPNERRPEYNIPIRYESADGRITPEQIVRLLGSKDLINNNEVRRDATDEDIAARVEDGAVKGFISPVALAANTGKEANEGNPAQGGFKEVFSRFVPDFDSTNRDVGIQGYRLLSALASLNSDGIELAPDQIPQSMWKELGITEDSEPLKITATLPEGGLDMNTVVQRKYRNGVKRDITMGDLLGANRGKRRLDAQKALLEEIAANPNEDNPARVLTQLVENENDLTAEATLKGLKSFARERKLSPNAAVAGYLQQLGKRINDSDRKRRFGAARRALKDAYKAELITESQMEELVIYKSQDDADQKSNELDELAEYLQTDLDVNWVTDDELVEMVNDFLDEGMWEVDTARDEFEQNEPREPTEDERFEAAMKSPEGGETRRMKAGIDQQNDAEERAARAGAKRRYLSGETAAPTETAGQARIRKAKEKAGLIPAGREIQEANEDIAREEGIERQAEGDAAVRETKAQRTIREHRAAQAKSRETTPEPSVVQTEEQPTTAAVDEGDGTLRKAKGKVADRETLTITTTKGDTLSLPIAGEFTLFGETYAVHKSTNGNGWIVSHKATGKRVSIFSRRAISEAAEDAVARLQQAGRASIEKALSQQTTPQPAETNAEMVKRMRAEQAGKTPPVRTPQKTAAQTSTVAQRRDGETNADFTKRMKTGEREQQSVVKAKREAATKPATPEGVVVRQKGESMADARARAMGQNSGVEAKREAAQPQKPVTGVLKRQKGESWNDFKARVAAAQQPTETTAGPKELTPEQRADLTTGIKAAVDEQTLDALQASIVNTSADAITVGDAEFVNGLIEQRRAELTAKPLGAYAQRLISGTEFVGDKTLIAQTVRNWSKKYLGGLDIRLVEYDPKDPDAAQFFAERKGRENKDTETRFPEGMAIRKDAFGPESPYIILLKKNGAGKFGTRYRRMHTLAHEFGHIIDREMLRNAPAEIQAGIDRAYQRLVTDLVNNGEIDNAMFNASSVVRFIQQAAMDTVLEGDTTNAERTIFAGIQRRKERGDQDYILSRNEFVAEQFAKYALGEPSIFAGESKAVQSYLDKAIAGIKKFYNEVIRQLDKAAPEFETFMKWLGTPESERPAFPDYDPTSWDERTSQQAEPTGEAVNKPEGMSNAEWVRSQKDQTPPPEGATTEPPNELPPTPPQQPPRGPQEPPQAPPPPPDDAARAKFRATVKRLLGNRVTVKFDAETLPDGVAAEYESRFGKDLEDTGKALKEVRERRREELRALKQRRGATAEDIAEERVDPRTPEQIEDSIRALEAQEQEYLNDLAIRGTIRVAAGMEAQAGLAEHEAFHAAFELFFGDNSAADRKAVTTAFTRGVLSNRLQKYFAGNAEVLAVIDPTSPDFNAEEAAAYAFQVFVHEPGALQMGQKIEGIFNRFLAYLQSLIGYKSYEERARIVFNDLNSGKRSERGTSALRDRVGMEQSMLKRSQDFVREVGTGFMHIYDTVLSSTYSRLEDSGNVAMAQIARLGYNETGQRGQGMIQLQRLATTRFGNQLKEALHTLTQEELDQLNQAMILGDELTGRLGEAQKRLRTILAGARQYQTEAGIDIGKIEDYYPMIWNPEKVAADYNGFIEMMAQYPEQLAEMNATADEVFERIASYEERGHEFQGVFGKDGEPVADSSKRRSLAFISKEDRLKYMEDDLVTTMGHYLNQSVRHAEYVRAYGQNGQRLKSLMGEITGTYGGSQDDVALAKDYIDGLMGNKEVGMSRELKDLYGAATVYQNVRLLPLSVFSSLVDPLGVAVRTQSMGAAFDTFAYSIRNMFTDFRSTTDWSPDQWEKYADDMGTIDMSGTVKSIDKIYTGVTLRGKTRAINDGFFKWNLLNGWVKNNHIMATKAAQLYLRRNAEGEMFTGEMRDQNLREAGVSAEDIVYDEKLGRIRSTAPEILGYENAEQMEQQATEEDIAQAREQADRIQQAIHKIVRQSLIQPSSAEMPGWMSNPYLAPIAHLKTFVFGFNATILKRLQYEAERGNYSPIYYAAAYVPGMIAADFIKGFAGNGGDEPEWKKNWGVSDYVSYGVDRSGLLGTGQFFKDMNNDVSRGGGGWETLAGPTIEQSADLMRAMNAKTSAPSSRWMLDAMPVNNLYDQWVMP